MIDSWVHNALHCAEQRADFYSGCRKILRSRIMKFKLNGALDIEDAGYTKSKLSMLRRGYLHVESREVAKQLWTRRLEQDKYGSVGFTTYNHFIKNDPTKKSKRASVMGPCIQSIVLTHTGKLTEVDVFYRTTEIFKKFPADLVFIRDELLDGFQINASHLTCYFANITAHPMYFITLVPSLDDPVGSLATIKHKDKYFFDWCVKWSARYICKEYSRGIDKFSQALRVRKDAFERIDKSTLRELQKYFKKNHPGYRNKYEEPIDGDSD
jgi:hypothetical protein